MKRQLARSVITSVLLLSFCGCATHFVSLKLNVEPSNAVVRVAETGEIVWWPYEMPVSKQDTAAGYAEFPKFIVEAPGHVAQTVKPRIRVDDSFWSDGEAHENGIYHFYQPEGTVRLAQDGQYKGPTRPNRIVRTIETEPAGAAVFQGRDYRGKTPLSVSWEIPAEGYERGVVEAQTVSVRHPGYKTAQLKLPAVKVKAEWFYKNGTTFRVASVKAALRPEGPDEEEQAALMRRGIRSTKQRDYSGLPAAARLERVRDDYQTALESLEEEHADFARALPASYRKALVDVQKKVQKEGDLDAYVAVGEEIKAFDRSLAVPRETGLEAHPSVQDLQLHFIKLSANAARTKAQSKTTLKQRYQSELTDLKSELTKAGEIESALKVQAEIRRLAADGRPVAAIR